MDRRVEVLNSIIDSHPSHGLGYEEEKIALSAMDEYMKECCLELLEYMAKNNVRCSGNAECGFLFKDEWITKEQLFENFL